MRAIVPVAKRVQGLTDGGLYLGAAALDRRASSRGAIQGCHGGPALRADRSELREPPSKPVHVTRVSPELDRNTATDAHWPLRSA